MSRFQCSPLLLLLVLSYAVIEGSFTPFWFLFFSLLHEGGHWLALHLLGGKTNQFFIRGYGFGIQINGLSYRSEWIVAFAGPLVNLFLAVVFFFGGLPLFTYINLTLGIMNLLPILPLDGGRVLRAVLAQFLPPHQCRCILQTISLILIFPLLALAFWQFLESGYNVSLLIICFYLLSLLKENGNDV